jgi:uncharacterized protein (DUF4415 family)
MPNIKKPKDALFFKKLVSVAITTDVMHQFKNKKVRSK